MKVNHSSELETGVFTKLVSLSVSATQIRGNVPRLSFWLAKIGLNFAEPGSASDSTLMSTAWCSQAGIDCKLRQVNGHADDLGLARQCHLYFNCPLG